MSTTTKTLTASIVSPPSIGASSGTTGSYSYYRVGHNTSVVNVDAVWSFTTPADVATRNLKWIFSWDNTSAGTGWSGSYTYKFTISESSASGTLVSGIQSVTETLSGASGTKEITFSDIALKPHTTYYLRANHNSTSTYSTMKAAYKTQSIVCTTLVPTLVRSIVTGYEDNADKYVIYAEVSNAVNVYAPTWTEADGQDDIDWLELKHYSAMGESAPWSINGQTYSYAREVKRSAHNNEYGTYISHLYANHGYGSNNLDVSYYTYYTQTLKFLDSDDTEIAASRSINWGDALGALPTPTKEGYAFTGWSVTKDGSKPVTSSTQLYKTNGFELVNTQQVQPACRLYAQWEELNACRIYMNGAWHNAKSYIYHNGAWKLATAYIYKNGEWKKCT